MQSDLVSRLRASGTKNAPKGNRGVYMSICDDAADAIEALTADNRMKDELLTAAVDDYNKALGEIARLRDALTRIVDCYDRNWQHQREKLDDIAPLARTALEANHG